MNEYRGFGILGCNVPIRERLLVFGMLAAQLALCGLLLFAGSLIEFLQLPLIIAALIVFLGPSFFMLAWVTIAEWRVAMKFTTIQSNMLILAFILAVLQGVVLYFVNGDLGAMLNDNEFDALAVVFAPTSALTWALAKAGGYKKE